MPLRSGSRSTPSPTPMRRSSAGGSSATSSSTFPDHLLGEGLARAPELAGEVLHFGEAVLHAEHAVRVVHVDAGFEREVRDGRGIHVDDVPLRMVREEMATTDPAPLPVAAPGLVEDADGILALGDFHCFGLPEGESVDGASRPTPARRTVAVARSHRLALDTDLDGATDALPSVHHR